VRVVIDYVMYMKMCVHDYVYQVIFGDSE